MNLLLFLGSSQGGTVSLTSNQQSSWLARHEYVAHTEEAMLSGGTYEFYFVTLCKINKHNKKLVHFTVVCFNDWQCDFFIHE